MRILLISVMGVLAGGFTGGWEGGMGQIWAMNEDEEAGRHRHGLSVLARHNTSVNYLESVDSGSVAIDIQEEEKQRLNGAPLTMISADVSKISHSPDQTVFTGNVTAEMLALKPASKANQPIPVGSMPTDKGILWGARNGQKDTLSSNVTYPSDFGGVSSVRPGTNQRTVSTGGWSVRQFFDRSKNDGQRLSDDSRPESFYYQADEPLDPSEPLVKPRPSLLYPRKEAQLVNQMTHQEDVSFITVNYEPPEKVSCWRRLCCCVSRKKPVYKTMSDASSQTEVLPPLFDLAQPEGWNRRAETGHHHGEVSYITTVSSDPNESQQTRNTSSLSGFQSNGPRQELSPEQQRVVHEWLMGFKRSPTTQVFPQPMHSIAIPIRFEASEQSTDTARFISPSPSGQ